MTPSYALVTPSFAPDFERCRLLAESVVRHAAPHLRHYIVVDHRDEQLFRPLRGPRTEVVVKEDVLPGRLVPLPFTRKWWLDLGGRTLLRGWILQQITKLAAPRIGGEDVFVFADSDAFFVRDYDPRDAIRSGAVPMFREQMAGKEEFWVEWLRVAARLFGLTGVEDSGINYVGPLVTWRRENVLRLHEHIEHVTGTAWWEAVAHCRVVSEYMLYGVFCEHVLAERSGHYWQRGIDALCAWDPAPLDETGLRALRDALRPEHAAVMISARSATPVADIRRVFEL